jgi:hypothetical protein
MRTKEENFLSMAKATNATLKRNKAKWENVKRFALSAQVLKDLISLTNEMSANAEIETTGATTDKHQAALDAVKWGVKMAKRASIYALDQKDMQLHDQLRTSRSSMLSRHDAETIAKLRDLHKRISPIVGKLEDYAVLPVDMQRLKQLTDAFENMESDPRDLIVERKTINGSIPKLKRKIQETLYQLDSLINIFDETPFEAEYLNARKIIDLGGRSDDDKDEKPEPPAE